MEAQGARPKVSRPANLHPSAKERLDLLRKYHDEAFLFVDQGLGCDEEGRADQALTLYRKGLERIDAALNLDITELQSSQELLQKANKLLAKMKQTKTQMESRIGTISSTTAMPPSYEESTGSAASTPCSVASAYDVALGESIMNDVWDDTDGDTLAAQALIFIPSGVQIFFITPEGYVSAPSYPSSLGIYKFDEQSKAASNDEQAPAFLKVGDWTYPLVPGCSPALHANWGAYMFPDPNIPGSTVGVIIPDNVSDNLRSAFENTLNTYTAMRVQTPEVEERNQDRARHPREHPRNKEKQKEAEEAMEEDEVALEHEHTSTKIAKGLVTAGEWLAWGLGKGAEKTGQLISKGSTKLREHLKPEEKPRQIDERAQTGAFYAKKATRYGVQVSAFVVSKVGEATMLLARQMAPHVKKQGEKLLPKSLKEKSEENGRSKVDAAVEVAHGGLQGWAALYLGLERAAGILMENVSKETVDTVEHKYGAEAGKFAGNTVAAVGNTGMAVWNVRQLGVKAIAKRVAKDTGKVIIRDAADPGNSRVTYNGSDSNRPVPSQDGDKSGVPPRPPPPAGVYPPQKKL